MKKFLRKSKKYIGLILIAAIAFNFAFLPLAALAADTNTTAINTDPTAAAGGGGLLSWITGKTLLFISSIISMILSAIFGLIIGLEAQIIDYIIDPTNFSFTNTPIVTLGWGITRDLANMFFILILLIIAFCTVLKIQSYAIKQLWWKVIVAALLINFSLVIAGFVIDFTQVLTVFFLNQATGGGSLGTLTIRLASSMQILNFYNPATPTSVLEGAAQLGASSLAAVMGIVLTLVGLVITVFVFGAAAVFLIVRILYIWFLLIIAPIVWMLWILPVTSKYFSQWWDLFIKWSFFAPIYVFMIYLSLSIFDATGHLNPKAFGVFPAAWKDAAPGLTTVGMPAAIFQWILVIAMMFCSLIVAQKFGVEGAAGARKILTGWGTSTKNWAGRYARRKGMGWTQPMTEEEKKTPPTGLRGRFRRIGAAIGGAAVAIPGARGFYLKQLEAEQKSYDAAYGKYKNVDPAVLEQAQKGLLEPQDRLAIQQALMEKKKFKPNAGQLMPILDQAKKYNKEEDFLKIVADKMGDDLTENNGYTTGQREELVRRAKSHNIEKDFSKLFPAIAARVLGKSIEEVVSKIEKAADILEDQLTAEVVNALSSDQLKSLAKSPNIGKRVKVKEVIQSDVRKLTDEESKNIASVLVIKDKNKREAARNGLPADLKALSRKMEIITAPGFEL